MPITALPSLDRTSATFKTDLDSYFLSALPAFSSEANALQTDVNAKQATASAAAVTATGQAAIATAQAQAAAGSAAVAGAVAWVSGVTYAVGDARYSPINMQTYRRKVAGAGATDPSLDATNWAKAVDALPVQVGNAGKFLTTNGTAESWGAVPAPGLTLLATLTPTVAANLDFLNVFSGDYDTYLVIGSGILPSAADSIALRFANAGAVDSGSKYYQIVSAGGTASTPQALGYIRSSSVFTSGGAAFQAVISNVNDTANDKTCISSSIAQSNSTFRSDAYDKTVYASANAISGFRLFWASASNFAATGKIRVYGYANT